jgi:hypothetical protein
MTVSAVLNGRERRDDAGIFHDQQTRVSALKRRTGMTFLIVVMILMGGVSTHRIDHRLAGGI